MLLVFSAFITFFFLHTNRLGYGHGQYWALKHSMDSVGKRGIINSFTGFNTHCI